MNTLLETYNQDLFLTINALPGTPGWLIDFATFSAEYLIFLLPLMLLIYWFTGGRAERETALFAIVTAITGLTLNFLCSAFYFHPRPFMIRLGHLWIDHAADTSFPSDHGTLFFSITLALWARVTGAPVAFSRSSHCWLPGHASFSGFTSHWIWQARSVWRP